MAINPTAIKAEASKLDIADALVSEGKISKEQSLAESIAPKVDTTKTGIAGHNFAEDSRPSFTLSDGAYVSNLKFTEREVSSGLGSIASFLQSLRLAVRHQNRARKIEATLRSLDYRTLHDIGYARLSNGDLVTLESLDNPTLQDVGYAWLQNRNPLILNARAEFVCSLNRRAVDRVRAPR